MKAPEWMHTASWLLGVAAAATLLLAGYTYATRGTAGVPGMLVLLALIFGSQAMRLKKWAARMDRADAEKDASN